MIAVRLIKAERNVRWGGLRAAMFAAARAAAAVACRRGSGKMVLATHVPATHVKEPARP